MQYMEDKEAEESHWVQNNPYGGMFLRVKLLANWIILIKYQRSIMSSETNLQTGQVKRGNVSV